MDLIRTIPIASLLLCVLAACEGDGATSATADPGAPEPPVDDTTHTDGTNTDDHPPGEDATTNTADNEPAPLTAAVWRATSVRLELSTFAFFRGSMAYDITRDLLSPEQLTMLEGLREIPTPTGLLAADYASYRIRVTDSSGEVVSYRAAQDDVIDSDEGMTTGTRSLAYETLKPFLDTLQCLSGKQHGPMTTADDPWNRAATLPSDPGCLNGVFVGGGASHSYRLWRVDTVGTYRLKVEKCFQEMRLQLFDPTGKQELAASAAVQAPECPSLVYQFTAPGVYRIDLQKRQLSSAPYDTAGDAIVSVRRE